MHNTTYQLRYVAFLDLLGFKNMVNQSVDNQAVLNNINRALSTLAVCNMIIIMAYCQWLI